VDRGSHEGSAGRGVVPGPRSWGGLARRGAAQVPPTGASDAWRAAARVRRDVDDQGADGNADAGIPREPPPPWEPEEWIDEGELRNEAAGAVERGRDGRPEGAAATPRRRSGPAQGTAAGREGRSAGASTPRRRPAGTGPDAGTSTRRSGPVQGPAAGREGRSGASTPRRRPAGKGPDTSGSTPGRRPGGNGPDAGGSTPGRRPGGNGPDAARAGGGRGRATAGERTGGAAGPSPLDDDLRGAVPSARLSRVAGRLREAGDAFSRGRFEDARRILRPLAQQAPRAAPVRELYGLSLYRLGRWAQAARELEAYRSLTGSAEQNPVLADSYRALGRYAEAEELWDELRAASPRAELVAEGRIVAAGALADQGRLDEAIDVLASAVNRAARKPQLHHLRMAYALADLYERAGDLPRARELFGRIAASDADFVDVDARLRALR
jgi:thioredoxin-like negative regulator of GroEL